MSRDKSCRVVLVPSRGYTDGKLQDSLEEILMEGHLITFIGL